MSTLLYGKLTSARQQAEPGTSTQPGTASPGVRTYVDGLAAIVPAEVLAAYAVIAGPLLSPTEDKPGGAIAITSPSQLTNVGIAMFFVAILLYFVAHEGKRTKRDYLRALIPGMAFLGWAALQAPSMFDTRIDLMVFEIGPYDATTRTAIGVIIAMIIGPVAARLAVHADKSHPSGPAAAKQRPVSTPEPRTSPGQA